MKDEEIRTTIETNFKLLALSMREASVRAGDMEKGLTEVRKMAESAQNSFSEMADRLDRTLEAIKTLAFGGAESKQEILALKEELESLRKKFPRPEDLP
ncbi:MAG: hypothetical protein KC910_15140 [Candidatus Eremiobacteraeota bacterium]|nr:hypothetical protein [Candidatus Eremiobacteraeota bacterium]